MNELASFLKNPVKTFFKERLKVVFEQEDPATEDVEPFTLDGLQVWQLQDELIQAQREVVEGIDASIENSEIQRMAVLEERLNHMVRRGVLADGGFRDVMRDNLAEPMAELFQGYRKALTDWPILISEEDDLNFKLETDNCAVTVAERLGGIRTNDSGERAWIGLESSNLVNSQNQYRPDVALKHWVRHLAHHLAGGPITTLVFSKKGKIRLEPLEPARAKELLDDQLRAWCKGMTRPLPFAVVTVTAWLRREDEARSAYEGGYKHIGEVARDACLRRAYPSYDALVASGEFATLAHQLIKPLRNALSANNQG
jgi:exodeoxyribonuclease V gamma subunit